MGREWLGAVAGIAALAPTKNASCRTSWTVCAAVSMRAQSDDRTATLLSLASEVDCKKVEDRLSHLCTTSCHKGMKFRMPEIHPADRSKRLDIESWKVDKTGLGKCNCRGTALPPAPSVSRGVRFSAQRKSKLALERAQAGRGAPTLLLPNLSDVAGRKCTRFQKITRPRR